MARRRDVRRFGPAPYALGLRRDGERWGDGFPFDIPAVAAIEELQLDAAVTTRAARAGAQFVIATHSPILLACPDARLCELDTAGLTRCSYEELETVRLTRAFLDAPERFVHAALEELA